ncbi:ribonuclease, putative [Trypanosoma cruzi marinkellei]|uniref:Ribonuclease, putative n=1 Tax=Trypanosoma cruzi marinkellei TaxID=85056 RepID=K2MX46_TRYCR|nr:ribonuclease, putative [Trypanosoma cruzi marinkellei]
MDSVRDMDRESWKGKQMTSDITYITRQNFTEVFPHFVRDLSEANFTAVDLEFTGIDRESNSDFLKLPEEAFLQKMAAARLFTPLQIGFSMFCGDTDPEGNSGGNTPGAGVDSQSYRDAMDWEAKSFSPCGLMGPKLKQIIESWVSKGNVDSNEVAELEERRREAENICGSVADSNSVYDQLCAYQTLNEIKTVIAMAQRWKGYAERKKRHVAVRNYSCYLFPAPGKDEGDRRVTLSSETAVFLSNNAMDFNRWVSEGLFFVSFDEYVKAQQGALCIPFASDRLIEQEGRVAAFSRWINALPLTEVRGQLSAEFNNILSFLKQAEVGDSVELNIPFMRPPWFAEFENYMRVLGLHFSRRTVTKVPSSGDEGVPIEKDARYFGTRLLEALVTATRCWKKILVIHNGLSDLAFLYAAMHQQLPKTLGEFKRSIRDMFPFFFDTRTLTCAPSLQNIGMLTATLKKTYFTLLKRNKRIQIHCPSSFEVAEQSEMKEHDAVIDAFMTGSLFLFAQEELAQVGSDFRRLRGITPIYGCVFSVNFEDEAANCIVHPPSAPMYLVHRPSQMSLKMEQLRSKLSAMVESVAFIFNGDNCLVKICDKKVEKRAKDYIDAAIREWCESLSLGFKPLDVASCVRAHNISYVSEMEGPLLKPH